MSFERDVFISYAHIDNEPFTPEQKGWVTLFHSVLGTILSQQLGKAATIWRDERLQGNDDFPAEISDQFPKTAVLISVLTPRYLKSDWCTKEIQLFCRAAETTGGLFVKNKGRVFKVMKTPITRSDIEQALPPEIGKTIGYEFFVQKDDQATMELDPAYGEEYRQAFFLKVRRLAGDIAELLGDVGAVAGRETAPGEDLVKPKIFLAECGTSRKDDREKVLGDLKSHGYVVLPEEDLPDDETHYVAEVERLLAQCGLSIHLVGSSYGTVPDGDSQKSVVVLQNEVAARLSRERGLSRVISLPEGTRSANAAQQAFIDELLKSSEMQFGADLITGDLQALMGTIHAGLKKRETPTPPRGSPVDQRSAITVHVLYDEKDGKDVVPLLRFLRDKGCEISRPIFTGEDAGKVREANQALLMGCDAVVLFYGAGDQTWKYYQQTELKKMRGLRGDRPLRAEFTYIAAPHTADKDLLVSLAEGNLVDALEGLSETAMGPFMQAISEPGAS